MFGRDELDEEDDTLANSVDEAGSDVDDDVDGADIGVATADDTCIPASGGTECCTGGSTPPADDDNDDSNDTDDGGAREDILGDRSRCLSSR